MEEDGNTMVHRVGMPLKGAVLSASVRDLSGFGPMLRRGGKFNGQRVPSAAAIADMTRGGDREKFKASGMSFHPGYIYRNHWWALNNADGA